MRNFDGSGFVFPDVDGENRGEHDRTVVRVLRSLEPLTGPTAGERQRIRDRILLALDADDAKEPARRAEALATAEPDAAQATDAPEGEEERPASPKRSQPPTPRRERPTASTSRRRTLPPTTDADQAATPAPERPDRGQRGASRPAHARGQTRPRRPGTKPGTRPETEPATRPATKSAAGARSGATRRGVLAGARGRLAVAALALLALVGSLAGMSVLLSRDALPGDALYGIKRTAEAASLGLTFGDEPKALKHLEFASARISEIETLARRYPDPADAPVGGYLTALTDFDNDATAGSRQLITLATRTDGRLLESLRDWSTQQASRLARVVSRLPGDARNRQVASRVLLDRITARADALLVRMDCYQTTSGSYDDIGALPATGVCEKRTPAPSSGTAPPSVAETTDNSAPPTGAQPPSAPLPSSEATPAVPPVPVPGATVSVPVTVPGVTAPPVTTTTPPLIDLSPLLPGLTIG